MKGNAVQEILARINKIAGVRGSLLVGADGLVVASDLAGEEDANTLGAVGGSLLTSLRGALEKMRRGGLRRYILTGEKGGAVLWPLESGAAVVVLLRSDINMGLVLVELKEAARDLARRIQL
jgi:predicted regulator of Ras-like GTPase activity (Roadblock/LC7/MglB family)